METDIQHIQKSINDLTEQLNTAADNFKGNVENYVNNSDYTLVSFGPFNFEITIVTDENSSIYYNLDLLYGEYDDNEFAVLINPFTAGPFNPLNKSLMLNKYYTIVSDMCNDKNEFISGIKELLKDFYYSDIAPINNQLKDLESELQRLYIDEESIDVESPEMSENNEGTLTIE